MKKEDIFGSWQILKGCYDMREKKTGRREEGEGKMELEKSTELRSMKLICQLGLLIVAT